MARRKRTIKKKKKTDPNIQRFKDARQRRIDSGQSLTKEGGAKDINLGLELTNEGSITKSQGKKVIENVVDSSGIPNPDPVPEPNFDGNEPVIVTPQTAKNRTIKNLNQLNQSVDQIKSAPEPKQIQTAEPSISDILRDDDDIQFPQSLQIQEQQVQSNIAQLEQLRSNYSESNQAMIRQMQSSLQRRLVEAQEVNKRGLEAQRMLGIRTGQSRFAPVLQANVMSAVERAGIQELASIEQKGLMLVSQAQVAANKEDYEMLNNIMQKREKLLTSRMGVFEKLATERMKQEKEMRLKLEKSTRTSTITNLLQSGVDDPIDIFTMMAEAGIDSVNIDEIMDFVKATDKKDTVGGTTDFKTFKQFFPEGGFDDYQEYLRKTSSAKRKPGSGSSSSGSSSSEENSLFDYIKENPELSPQQYTEWAEKNTKLSVGQINNFIETTDQILLEGTELPISPEILVQKKIEAIKKQFYGNDRLKRRDKRDIRESMIQSINSGKQKVKGKTYQLSPQQKEAMLNAVPKIGKID